MPRTTTPAPAPSRVAAAWLPALARASGAAGDRALARRDWWTDFLTGDLHLFPKGTLDLPVPRITDTEYEQRVAGTFSKGRGPQSLILQLPNALHAPHVRKKSQRSSPSLAYNRFMDAVGEPKDWTATDAGKRKEIRWEPVLVPTWRWIEGAAACPRIGTSWNDLTALFSALTPPSHLPSLEEYVPLWYAIKQEHGRTLDVSTYTWLRTRFGPSGSGAPDAGGRGCRVLVCGWDAAGLGIAYGCYGSRASDPATNPA